MALSSWSASRLPQELHQPRCSCSHRACARPKLHNAAAAPHTASAAVMHCTDTSRREQLLRLASVVAAMSWRAPALAAEPLACSSAVPPAGLPLLSLQSDYDRYAATYNELDGGVASEALGFPELRRALLSQASGSVLELAVGSGLNLPLYNWQSLTSVTGLDLSQGMLTRAAAAAKSAQLPAIQLTLLQGDVASLPFEDASFDCVVDTFSLCVFEQPGAALREAARVVKPGGRVLLLEHTRSESPLLGAYQDLTASAVTAMSKGCAWNQDVPALLAAAGLKPVRLERHLGGLLALIEAVPMTRSAAYT